MAYRLFIANKKYSSWSMRPWVLMTALDMAFEEILTAFEGGGRQPAFARFSPTGKVPCLHDHETVVWDSLAISEYLAEQEPRVWPIDRGARAWARSAVAEMHSGFPAMRDECSMNCQLVIHHEAPSEALLIELQRLNTLWQEGLERFGGPWLAGTEFTAADAFYAPVAVRVRGYNLALDESAMAYVDRILSHPAVDRWVQAGINETLEEDAHAQDCLRGRPVLHDRREGSPID